MSNLQSVATHILTCALGIVSALILTKHKWNIRKLELKHQYRKELIMRARDFIGSSKWDQCSFNDTVEYAEIRQFLSKETLDAIEGSTVRVRIGRGGNVIKSSVLDDLSKLEQEWGLI